MPANQMSQHISSALRAASDTRELRVGEGALNEVPDVFRRCFQTDCAIIVADVNTMEAAGRQVLAITESAGLKIAETFIFRETDLHARMEYVDGLQKVLAPARAPAIAVGSGTINDLVKLASYRCERPYMSVATAASMDGYTAFGASINHEGSKQTFFCPAPRAVVADLDVICKAPAEMNAAGYADLAAKVTAGADWILADALGCEAIDLQAWSMVQPNLRQWLADPEAIRRGKRAAIAGLTEGLMMTGLAMQWSKSSRPASGAEHQFSHLWDMQDHHHAGRIPFHGFKVAIGTLASTMLYEQLLCRALETLDIDAACRAWTKREELDAHVRVMHQRADLRTVALRELQEKYIDREALAGMLKRLAASWPVLKNRLREQLIPSMALRQMLRRAGAPDRPEQIGIDLARLRRSYLEGQQIRRRFTVLDLATMTGLLPDCLEHIFAARGPWGEGAG